MLRQDWSPARVGKFRQAGFVYLHVAILYEAAVYAMLEAGTLPTRFGPPVGVAHRRRRGGGVRISSASTTGATSGSPGSCGV